MFGSQYVGHVSIFALIVFRGSSSRCHGLVCSVRLWPYLIIFTYVLLSDVVLCISFRMTVASLQRSRLAVLSITNELMFRFASLFRIRWSVVICYCICSRVKSGSFGHQVNSDSDPVCFIL